MPGQMLSDEYLEEFRKWRDMQPRPRFEEKVGGACDAMPFPSGRRTSRSMLARLSPAERLEVRRALKKMLGMDADPSDVDAMGLVPGSAHQPLRPDGSSGPGQENFDDEPQASMRSLTDRPSQSGRALDRERHEFLRRRLSAQDLSEYYRRLGVDEPLPGQHVLTAGTGGWTDEEPMAARNPHELGAMPHLASDQALDRRELRGHLDRIGADANLGGGLHAYSESDRHQILQSSGLRSRSADEAVWRALAQDAATQRRRDAFDHWPECSRIGIK
jgi:hypothetical protein